MGLSTAHFRYLINCLTLHKLSDKKWLSECQNLIYPNFSFLIWFFPKERRHFWGLKIVKVACEAAVAGVPIAVNILLLLASHNTPTASAVATDSSVTDVVSAVGFPRVPAVADVPAADVVLTAVNVPRSSWCVSNVFSTFLAPAVVSLPAVAGLSAVAASQLLFPPCCCWLPCCWWLPWFCCCTGSCWWPCCLALAIGFNNPTC